MDEPHVHLFARRSAETRGLLGPVALAAGAAGLLVWLISLDADALGVVGRVVGLCGMLIALSAAIGSSVGLLSRAVRAFALRGLVTSAAGILVPAAVAFLVLSFVWR